jgi:hypothetical protein
MSEERGLFGPLSRTLPNGLFDMYYLLIDGLSGALLF